MKIIIEDTHVSVIFMWLLLYQNNNNIDKYICTMVFLKR